MIMVIVFRSVYASQQVFCLLLYHGHTLWQLPRISINKINKYIGFFYMNYSLEGITFHANIQWWNIE